MGDLKLNSSNDLNALNEKLLLTLDEKIFFAELSKYLLSTFKVESILVFSAFEDGAAQIIADSGRPVESDKILEKGKSLASYVIKTRRPYYSNSVNRDPLFSEFNLDPSILAELCIPVTSQGVVLATINFRSTTEEVQFDQNKINEVQEVLNSLDHPLHNMKMYLAAKQLNKSLQRKIDEKEKELEKRETVVNTVEGNKITPQKIIGNSGEIKRILDLASKIAPVKSNVLLLGESGTGKEVLAKKIHCESKNSKGNYIVVNCGAIQESLLESELFGHVKGSFTGAMNEKLGLVEKAHKGTLFLDEVAELTPAMQTKLLRFLEDGEAYRVGATSPYRVDTRIIAATNKDLKLEVEEGRFREDLFYRLNTISIKVPALRDREEDICLLATAFLNEKKPLELHKTLTPGAINVLKSYDWPGNIRELKNIMERAYILSDGKFIEESHLTDCTNSEGEKVVVSEEFREETLSELEKKHIVKTLDHLSGNKTKTAKVLGITVKTLYNKLHSYGMINSRDSIGLN